MYVCLSVCLCVRAKGVCVLHMNKASCSFTVGLCVVDQTPKGWFMKYIDRSPAEMARQAVRILTTNMALTYNYL